MVSLITFSCIKDPNAILPNANKNIVAIQFDSKTLSFQSNYELDSTIVSLVLMPKEEREKWMSQQNFTSQYKAIETVSQQMRKCNTLDQVMELQNAYPFFIFNDDLSEGDITTYEPTNRLGQSWVCNAYGNVTIAGKVVNLNDIKSYPETWIAKVSKNVKTKGVDTKDNYLHSYTDSRKMWAEAYSLIEPTHQNPPPGMTIIKNIYLVVRFAAQQKICHLWCYWDSYSNEFTIRMVNRITGTDLYGRDDNAKRLLNNETIEEKMNGDYINFGVRPEGIYTSGSLEVYSNGVGVANKGILTIRDPERIQ